nr:membrane protein insertase YidC [Solirubrobacterales bacterium]
MEKRVLLAVVLSFIVLYGYQAMFPPPAPRSKPVAPSAPAPIAPGIPAQQDSTPTTPAPATPPGAAPVVADTTERDVVVESDAVRAVFTTRGAVLKSWRLKKYQDLNGKPLDLVPQSLPPGNARPFTLVVPDGPTSAVLQEALYKPSSSELTLGASPATLTFEYQDANGLSARKDFTFSPNQPYVVDFSATVARAGAEIPPTLEWGPGIGTGIAPASSMGMYSPPAQPIFYKEGKVSRIAPNKIQENATQDGKFGFSGVDDHYFLAAAVISGQPLHVEYRPVDVQVTPEQAAHFVAWSARFQASPRNVRFFLGPKDFEVLESVDRDLTRAIDFGMFAWLVVPLLRALKWVNGYVGNYGWSIIILTALINIAMFPLRHKSVVSM